MAITVAELLARTTQFFKVKGIGSARLDAELLLGEVLTLQRLQLYTSFDRPMQPAELDAYRDLVRRRGAFEPVAYILGGREFYGRDFTVDARVLIPRPDTEILVDEILGQLDPDTEGVALDYGTGSGCIGLTLLAERPQWKLLAVDASRDALDVARANATSLEVADRAGFIHSDGLSRVPERFEGGLLLLVANPPYVPLEDRPSLSPDVRDHEPEQALHAGPDPLVHYKRLAAEAPRWLAPDGLLAVEVGFGQADAVRQLFADAGFRDLAVRADLGGVDRVVRGVRPA